MPDTLCIFLFNLNNDHSNPDQPSVIISAKCHYPHLIDENAEACVDFVSDPSAHSSLGTESRAV